MSAMGNIIIWVWRMGNYSYDNYVEVSLLTNCLTLCVPSSDNDGTIMLELWPLYTSYNWSVVVGLCCGANPNGYFCYLVCLRSFMICETLPLY